MSLLCGRELLAEDLAGSLQAGTYGAFGNAENPADLAGVQLFKGGEDKRNAELFWKGIDETVDGGLQIGVGDGVVRAGMERREDIEGKGICGCGRRGE